MTWNPVVGPPAAGAPMLRYAQPAVAAKPCPACPTCPNCPSGDHLYQITRLLLHGNGANNSTTFTDNSTLAFVPTLVGTPVISTAQFKYGTASIKLNGTTDALSYAHSTALALNTGDFTIEAWIYATSLSTARTILQKDQTFGTTFPSYALQILANGAIDGLVGTGNGATSAQHITSATGLVSLNTWHHVAFTRDGSTLRLFLNGALVQTAAQTASPADGGKVLLIGRYPGGGGTADAWWAGHLDDVRITRGYARYVAAFTPPAAELPHFYTP